MVGSMIGVEDISRDDLRKACRAQSRAQPPDEILPLAQHEVVHEIHVEGIPVLGLIRLQTIHSVVVSLQLNVGPVLQNPLPPCQKIAARKLRVLIHIGNGRRSQRCDPYALPGDAVVDIALHR